MRQLIVTLTLVTMATLNSASAQQFDLAKVKSIEHQLDDVMELIDTATVKRKLIEVEEAYRANPNELNTARLGIVYHETALNLSFLAKSSYQGYAKKSFDVLTGLHQTTGTTRELKPFIASYRASALALVSAETRKLNYLSQAFAEFQQAIDAYGDVSYCPEFMRGSVAENLPWFFFSKVKFAKLDFQSIIDKQEKNEDFANWKIMSFTYWAWANQHQSKRYRKQAISYLNKAIELDKDYQGGRKRAEELLTKLMK